MTVVNSDDRNIAAILERLQHLPGALLPVLHEVQHEFGYIPDKVVPDIARALNLSRAEVHGVISFYHHFRSTPPGKHLVQVCRAEACQAVGARELEAHIQKTLSVETGATTADGQITVEPVYCLGNCACGPSLQVDESVHGRVTPEKFNALISDIGAK